MLLTVCCVLKSGGDFNEDHVYALKRQVEDFLPHDLFLCYSDTKVPGIATMPCTPDYPDWWNKIHIFEQWKTPTVYFDLDTMIFEDLTGLANAVSGAFGGFFMLEAWHRMHKWASGVMAWNGDFRYLRDGFRKEDMAIGWDQRYIAGMLERNSERLHKVQDYVRVDSYKNDGKKDDTAILCFHGKPRPWETDLWTF